jgi:multidrug efflux pump subunit AcrA (membrane-fusion protein)
VEGTRAGCRPLIDMRSSIHPRYVAIAALLATLGCGNRGSASGSSETAVAETRRFSATVMAIGALRPRIGAEVRVGSLISGRVRRLRANIGDTVRRGAVIAELETAELDATVAERRRRSGSLRHDSRRSTRPRRKDSPGRQPK